jgi:hypothetical protein
MKINRDNYEAYFLDYHEGQLSPEMVEEVKLFVTQNPDLKPILDEFEAVSLVADQDIVFEKKSSLKKNQIFATSQVNELNYEEYLVSEVEGLLNAEELSAIEEFISINPQFEKDRRLFALAHLTTDDDIVYESKESLKKKAIPVGAIDAETFETFMAREIEGDLNPDEKLQLAEFMQYNPHLEKDRKLYTHTKLNVETDIVFEDKNSLKRAAVIPIRRIVYYALSAAASLALIFSVYFLLDRNDIPGKLANQDKASNKVDQVITEPSKTIPDKQVATNVIKPEVVVPNPGKNNSSFTNTAAQNDIAVRIQVQEPLASIDRHAIEFLPTRSATEVTTRSYVDPEFTFIRVSQMYMNQNLEFYYNLKLNQELEYAERYSKDKEPGKTIFNSIKGKVGDLLASNHKVPPKEEQKNVSLWTFAELGVKTFNTITSSEVELNLKKDDEGKVVGYDLEGNLINIERELKK